MIYRMCGSAILKKATVPNFYRARARDNFDRQLLCIGAPWLTSSGLHPPIRAQNNPVIHLSYILLVLFRAWQLEKPGCTFVAVFRERASAFLCSIFPYVEGKSSMMFADITSRIKGMVTYGKVRFLRRGSSLVPFATQQLKRTSSSLI